MFLPPSTTTHLSLTDDRNYCTYIFIHALFNTGHTFVNIHFKIVYYWYNCYILAYVCTNDL